MKHFTTDLVQALKEVLAYAIAPTEFAYIWNELLQDAKARGTEEALLLISDGLKGIVDAIGQLYPKAKFQTCCVHLSRNIAHKVRVTDRTEICNDSFPRSIWESIYSTYLIESFNKQIKKYTKRKEQLPHEEALEKFLIAQFEGYNQRFATRCNIGFDQACAELQEMFSSKD